MAQHISLFLAFGLEAAALTAAGARYAPAVPSRINLYPTMSARAMWSDDDVRQVAARYSNQYCFIGHLRNDFLLLGSSQMVT